MTIKEKIEERIALLKNQNENLMKSIKLNEVEPQQIETDAKLIQANLKAIKELEFISNFADLYE